MEITLPGVLIVGLVLCGAVLVLVVGSGLLTLLIKFGVIVRAAQRPPHADTGEYRLDQGREVRGEDERP